MQEETSSFNSADSCNIRTDYNAISVSAYILLRVISDTEHQDWANECFLSVPFHV
jgi:hypothetical protein